MANNLITYKKVSLNYGNTIVLENIDFELNSGDFLVINGEIGAGKTTFLKSIYAEIPIAKGSAKVLDFNLQKVNFWNQHKLRRQIGYIFQNPIFLDDKTVYENLEFVLKATNNKEDIKQKIKQALEKVGLDKKINYYPYQLSAGEKQKLSLARALLNNPKIILADEPTANLDVSSSKFILEFLYSLSKNNGIGVILVTHEPKAFDNYSVKRFVIANRNLKIIYSTY